jgi:ribA/ribD-fused uncharacterized protein
MAGDFTTCERIYAVEHGHGYECHELASNISGLNNEDWDAEKANTMEAGVFAKFWTPDPSLPSGEDLLRKLLSTGDRELVYAVEEDSVWGIGFRPSDAEKNRGSWGENLLGKAIMELRRICRVRKPTRFSTSENPFFFWLMTIGLQQDLIAMRVCPGRYPFGEHTQK